MSIFKKGARNCCDNVGYKIYSKIINERLKTISDALLIEEQSGFRTGRSCIDNVFVIKQLFEKRREFNLETHVAFIDFEKAFDRINRTLLWEIMERRGYSRHLINVLRNSYRDTTIVIDTSNMLSEEVLTNQGVRLICMKE